VTKKITLKSPENPEENAKKIQQIMESSLGKHFKQVAEFQESANQLAKTLVPALKPIQDTISRLNDSGLFRDIQKMRGLYSELLKPTLFHVENLEILPSFPRTIISEDGVEEIIQNALERSVETGVSKPLDLIWNMKEKILSRVVPGIILNSPFEGGETKRMNLLEKLMKTRGYVESRELKDFLDCPTTEAVRKLKQGINKRVREDLNITEDVVEGRKSFGYRINPLIDIHKQ
jgi:hypothetical protein